MIQSPNGSTWRVGAGALTGRFPLIVEALAACGQSCMIDGEAVCCDESGIAQFNRIRCRSYDGSVFLYAFDLIEVNGNDLRRGPLEVRKATLASTLAEAGPGIRLNKHLECDDGETVFRHACKMGLEGIVSKRARPRLSLAVLDQEQKPERSGSKARSRRGLGQMISLKIRPSSATIG